MVQLNRQQLALRIGTAALAVAVFVGCTPDQPGPSETSAPASPGPSYAGPGGASAPGIPGASAPEPSSSTNPDAPVSMEASADPTTVPTMGEAPAEAVTVADTYLDARENAVSWDQDEPRSWLATVKPIMTDDGYDKLSEKYSNEGSRGHAWSMSHQEGLAVKVATECAVPSAAGSTKSAVVVRCGVTDQVVDKKGEPVPLTQIPSAWPYVGPQQPAVLSMVHKGGEWLISADLTGQVS